MVKAAIRRPSSVKQVVSGLSNPSKEWYAVYTVVRHEKVVSATLCGNNIETFLPIMEVTSQWKDRRKKVQLPLFPGYLFVNIRLQDRWNVLNTRGVVKVLGVNGNPIPVPVEQISSIKRLIENKIKCDPYSYFASGREVLVINGPLQGIKGKIIGRRGNYRLVLSVDVIQRSVSVEVDIRDVEMA